MPQKKLDRYADWQVIQTQAFYRHSDCVFMRRSCRFARVATLTGNHDIVDCVRTPTRKRHGMVDCPFTPRKPNPTVATLAIFLPQGLQFTASYDTNCFIFSGSSVCASRSLIKPVMRRTSSIPPLSVSVHYTIVPRLSVKAPVHDLIGLRYIPTPVGKTSKGAHCHNRTAVHPHACGENN